MVIIIIIVAIIINISMNILHVIVNVIIIVDNILSAEFSLQPPFNRKRAERVRSCDGAFFGF